MLKLGKLTDYAVAVMVQLSKEEGSRSASMLSHKIGVPEPTVAKVLKTLARQKLVESERGVTGGYRLGRNAAEITIADVIEAMDGPIAIVACVEGADDTCNAEPTCPAKGKWVPVNNAIRAALSSVKLTDMATTSCGDAQQRKLYQITGGADADRAGGTHVLHD